tara:strand:+ start:9970 stop:11400 length:1431 start_codon:yes stop_codon:yes gene_type:complete
MSHVSTYIGEKGYSIYKNSISIEEQQWIRSELMVRPYVPKSPIKQPAFPVYRESPQKLYVPRFFGTHHYGKPDEYKISSGIPINVNFKGTLRDEQITVVSAYMDAVNSKNGGGGLLDLHCGGGKTVLALNIISRLKVKTLVIVHKSFLLNQWIERIEQFLPDAKIGRIQGQVIDIEGKDIVIGMLQSLSMKDYPSGLFSVFGLTLVDECHHISSEVFSRSLLNIVTKYMLGLSATMQRKDGLTPVFKMFLGEIVYKDNTVSDDDVLVKQINYFTNDDNFNETVYDYRGNPQYSTMISKLCSYTKRSEFIIDVIKNELKIFPEQQIMILAQNKNLLKYLHDTIYERNIASVGYYVGGMKETELKNSETKKIIVATFAMAAEGLDIKTLSTLLMATPRTDITQSVGRILRIKHKRPLVIDIVDSHDIFKRQWKKRVSFYKKKKYKIISTTNTNYYNNIWENFLEKSKKKTNKCLIDNL